MQDEKDYSKGKIYKICSKYTELPYIGSTIQELAARLNNHQSNLKCYKNGTRRYCSSYEVVQYADAWIELIEYFPCKTKKELENREADFIKIEENDVRNCVNINNPASFFIQGVVEEK